MKNNKALGQHWLKDRTILDQIADLALPECPQLQQGEGDEPHDDQPLGRGRPKTHEREKRPEEAKAATCLEIGPGLGTLTSSLLKRFGRVIAVEYDPRLAANLPKSFPGTNLEVVHADFLQTDLSTMPTPYVVAGNIPYYITSPIIFKLLAAQPQPERIVLLIQKEVAERILAAPGHHTYLSLSVQNFAIAEPGFLVPKSYFTPPPKVDSAVIILTPLPQPLLSDRVLKFAKQGFSNPRKKLSHNLPYDKAVIERALSAAGLSPDARAADLSHDDWQNLFTSLTA